jgi:hypothetical protein
VEEQFMAELWERGIEWRVSGGCENGRQTEKTGGRQMKKRESWPASGIRWAQRCFSRFASVARPLFTVAAWLKRRNAEKIDVGGEAAKQAVAGVLL